MKSIMLHSRILIGVVTLAIAGATAGFSASPIVEYLFEESGTVASNTGSAASADLTLGKNGATSDTHSPEGDGYSGLRALDHRFGDTAIGARGVSGNVPELDGLDSFTLMGWYDSERSDGWVGNERRLFDTGASDTFTFRLEGGESGPGQDMLRLRIGGNTVVSGAGTYPDDGNEYVFFAVTYDGSQASDNVLFYRGNDSTEPSVVATVSLNAGPVPVRTNFVVAVGGRIGFNGPRTFHGLLDNARIFGSTTDASGALSDLEILSFYLIDKGSEPVPVPSDIETAVEILWNSTNGAVYEVQYTDDLVVTNWFLLEQVVGTGGTNSVFDSTIGVTNRSYRVLQTL